MSLPERRPATAVESTLLRSRYVSNSVDAMSPGRMIVALYDRLLVDLERADAAVASGDPAVAHECLLHAQAIVAELHDTLDLARWPSGRPLADLYVFVHTELVTANVQKDRARIASCYKLLTPLRDAWTEAAGVVPASADVSQ